MTATDAMQWESRVVGGSRFADGSAIVRPRELPWTDGPLDGLSFRLTHVDDQTSMWTALFKAAPDTTIPAHYNYGEVQIHVHEGSLTIGDLLLGVGHYCQFPGGPMAEIATGPDGATYFVMYTAGGLSLTDMNGEPSGPFFNATHMYRIAAGNDAAAHLPGVI